MVRYNPTVWLPPNYLSHDALRMSKIVVCAFSTSLLRRCGLVAINCCSIYLGSGFQESLRLTISVVFTQTIWLIPTDVELTDPSCPVSGETEKR